MKKEDLKEYFEIQAKGYKLLSKYFSLLKREDDERKNK